MGLGVGFGFIPHLAVLNDDRMGIATARDRVTEGHGGSQEGLIAACVPPKPHQSRLPLQFTPPSRALELVAVGLSWAD